MRVVIGHSGVKTIVFLHKKSAIRTFVGDCCSETSGGRGEVPGQTIGDIHTDVLSTQHYSTPVTVLAAHLSSGNLPSS